MKARAEGEVAANPLGDLSPFIRRAWSFILSRVYAVCIFGTVGRICIVVRVLAAEVFRYQRQ